MPPTPPLPHSQGALQAPPSPCPRTLARDHVYGRRQTKHGSKTRPIQVCGNVVERDKTGSGCKRLTRSTSPSCLNPRAIKGSNSGYSSAAYNTGPVAIPRRRSAPEPGLPSAAEEEKSRISSTSWERVRSGRIQSMDDPPGTRCQHSAHRHTRPPSISHRPCNLQERQQPAHLSPSTTRS